MNSRNGYAFLKIPQKYGGETFNDIFLKSCINGDVHTLNAFIKQKSLSRQDVLGINLKNFEEACKYNLNIVKYLVETYKLTDKELTNNFNTPFLNACEYNRLNIAKYLYYIVGSKYISEYYINEGYTRLMRVYNCNDTVSFTNEGKNITYGPIIIWLATKTSNQTVKSKAVDVYKSVKEVNRENGNKHCSML